MSEIKKLIKLPLEYKPGGSFDGVFDNEQNLVAQIRADILVSVSDPERRAKLQDEIGEYIADAINNHDRLKQENKELKNQFTDFIEKVELYLSAVAKAYPNIHTDIPEQEQMYIERHELKSKIEELKGSK